MFVGAIVLIKIPDIITIHKYRGRSEAKSAVWELKRSQTLHQMKYGRYAGSFKELLGPTTVSNKTGGGSEVWIGPRELKSAPGITFDFFHATESGYSLCIRHVKQKNWKTCATQESVYESEGDRR